MGVSSMHASTVGLVRNIHTGNISPQYHVVYNDLFETVQAESGEPPAIWEDLVVFNKHQSDFDNPDFEPELADEWLSAEERQERQAERARRAIEQAPATLDKPTQPQPLTNKPTRQDVTFEREEVDGTVGVETVKPSNLLEVDDYGDELFEEVVQPPEPVPEPEPLPPRTRPRYVRHPQKPKRYGFDEWSYYGAQDCLMACYCYCLALSMIDCSETEQKLRQVMALMTDVDAGRVHDDYHPTAGMTQGTALKATKTRNPDVPMFGEAMSSEHRAEFEEAMDQEVLELIQHDTWLPVKRKDVPRGANILPGTWAFRIKRYPDGRLRKFKARFCVRGDKQLKELITLESMLRL